MGGKLKSISNIDTDSSSVSLLGDGSSIIQDYGSNATANYRFQQDGKTPQSLPSSTIEVDDDSKKNDQVNIRTLSVSSSLDDDVVFDKDGIPLENSIYPEVRSAVPIKDDPSIRVNHWRTWFLTTVFVGAFAAVNQFFSLRYPSMSIGFIVAQLISYPVGSAFTALPDYQPLRKRGVSESEHHLSWRSWFDLNPGPYSVKEHAVLTICVSLTASSAYAMSMLIAQTKFYFQEYSIVYEILLVITSQMLGYGAAGLTRRWVVYPGAMIWPETLVSSTLFNTIHGDKNENNTSSWTISRYKFFTIVLAASFAWYWVPGFLFTGLSYFTIICWIRPNSKVLNGLFGYKSGLGILPITFDWTQVSQVGSSPLATPFWVTANIFASVVIFFWILVPILYYNNVWYSKYLPLLSSSTFDNTGQAYNASRVLSGTLVFNQTAYEEYSPLLIPFSYTMSYALNFAAVTAVFVHCALYHGKDIMAKLRDASHGGEDIHKRLMRNYKEVPDWWYFLLFLIVFAFSIVVVTFYDTQLPVWGLFMSVAISLINFLPQGLLEAITNQHVGLNIVTELIGGYLFPGKPIANLMVKLYGFVPMRQGLDFSRDLKLAQYMKVPPVLLFWMQIYCTVFAALVNVCVQRWMRLNIEGICDINQPDGFSCAGGRTIYNASIIWGAVGPRKMFSAGKMYHPILYFFLIGMLVPFITYALYKRHPQKWYGKLNAPVFFTGSGNIPPATGVNYASFAIVGFVFNYLIKKKWRSWWTQYNYVLSAGLDSGVAIATVLIFLCVTYPGGKLEWWGNTVWKNTRDYKYLGYYTLAEGETFGPKTWS